MSEHRQLTWRVNGTKTSSSVEPRTTLADHLRDDLGLTGTHLGCEHGYCGACTVLFDGEAARSCLMLAVQADGHDVTTVEGLADGEELSPLQAAFTRNHALQCGFCTPGMLTSMQSFLDQHNAPTEDEVRKALSGNLCRCTGYAAIVKSVLEVADERGPAREVQA